MRMKWNQVAQYLEKFYNVDNHTSEKNLKRLKRLGLFLCPHKKKKAKIRRERKEL